VPHFVVEADRSKVVIEARSSVHPIHSETTGIEGYIDLEWAGGEIDCAASCRGRLELAVARLSSGNGLYDREMQRRIDARRYPTILGELGSLEPGDVPDRYRVTGTVTLRGTSGPAKGEMTIRRGGESELVLAGEHVFDIREFGIEPPKIMMLRVFPDVTVRIDLRAKLAG
jgi:polyisoprenoid-binding protein YceI